MKKTYADFICSSILLHLSVTILTVIILIIAKEVKVTLKVLVRLLIDR